MVINYFMVYHALDSGETTRKGFYMYDDKRRANPDPELKKYIEKSRSISGVAIDPKVSLSLSYVLLYTPHTRSLLFSSLDFFSPVY